MEFGEAAVSSIDSYSEENIMAANNTINNSDVNLSDKIILKCGLEMSEEDLDMVMKFR